MNYRHFDHDAWRAEVIGHEELFIDLHDHLPPEIVYERELLMPAVPAILDNASKEPPSCRAVTAYRTSASSPAISLWNRYSPARRWSASKFCPKTIRFGACRPVWTTI
jgi:hypothetical protein